MALHNRDPDFFFLFLFYFYLPSPLTEYDNDSFASTPEYKAALSTPWRQRVIEAGIDQRERRVMKLYRAWDPEAALKEVERRDEDAGR